MVLGKVSIVFEEIMPKLVPLQAQRISVLTLYDTFSSVFHQNLLVKLEVCSEHGVSRCCLGVFKFVCRIKSNVMSYE